MIDFRLYVITDRKRCAPRTLENVVREACEAGVRAVLLREKDLAGPQLRDLAHRLLHLAHSAGAMLTVNCGAEGGCVSEPADAEPVADGYHFPDGAAVPGDLRRRRPGVLVGMSVHSASRGREAAGDGADYVLFGPIFETASKARFGPPQGLGALAQTCAACPVPVFAVGGVTPENAARCIEAGAHGVAVIGAVMGAARVPDAVRRFEEALGGL